MDVLPTRIADNIYAQFEIGYDYFGINLLQRTYLTMTQVDVLKCRGEGIVICPAEQAVYSREIDSCSLSLYLQRARARPRNVQKHSDCPPGTPRLDHHGSSVLYYLVAPQLLHIQFQHDRSWQANTMTMEMGGYLDGAISCYLAVQGMHLYSALRGETEFAARVPILFTPAVHVVASADEMETLRQMSFLNETHLEELSSSISSHHIEADINTLFHLHASSLQHASKSYWII